MKIVNNIYTFSQIDMELSDIQEKKLRKFSLRLLYKNFQSGFPLNPFIYVVL